MIWMITQMVLVLHEKFFGGEDGCRTKLLPYTNFYIEVLTQFRIKLLRVEVLTKVWIKLLCVELLTIFPEKASTLTK